MLMLVLGGRRLQRQHSQCELPKHFRRYWTWMDGPGSDWTLTKQIAPVQDTQITPSPYLLMERGDVSPL